MAFRWMVRATPTEGGLLYVRPVLKDKDAGTSSSEQRKWTERREEKYPLSKEETVRALRACQDWCDRENAKLAARAARVEEARRWAQEAIAQHGQEVDQSE